MAVRVQKSAVNIREKLAELERPIGIKGNELMRAETAQDARDLVSAGRKNLVINGDLRIWQRATSATLNNSTSQTYKTADRWSHYHQTDGAVTESQSTDVPTGAGFYYSLKHEVSTADTSIAAGQYHAHRYDIEGHDVAHLMWGTSQAKTITVSFWAKSSVSGDYGFCIRPGANYSRFYVDTLTISQANTWKRYSFTVPGCTDGTWEKTTSAGLEVQISHSMGTTYQTSTLRQWTSSIVVSPTTQVNWMATVGNTWYITGLQVEVGKNATDFDHRPVGQEFALCQRYCYVGIPAGAANNTGLGVAQGGYGANNNVGYLYLNFPANMRTGPTLEYDSIQYNNSSVSTTPSSLLIANVTTSSCGIYIGGTATQITLGSVVNLRTTNTTGYLRFIAEL